jgi:hypothetical protein
VRRSDDTGKGERCNAVVHDSSKTFFSEKNCLESRTKQIADFRAMKLLRWTATCHKVDGPFLEPPPKP